MAKKKETSEENLSAVQRYLGIVSKVTNGKSGYVENPGSIEIEKFPTGSYFLDRDLKGGWAKGTLIECFGPSGSSKTTLCIHAVAEHMKKYPEEPVLWLDLEKVFDPTYFSNIGVDIELSLIHI